MFADLGVRVIQLTYNQANHLGDGSMAPENRGLTTSAARWSRRSTTHRVMVDLSHSGEQTCLEAIRASRAADLDQPHRLPRADRPAAQQDRRGTAAGRRRGGFVGIYFMPFLNPTGHATAADVVAHIEHAVNVCGEDHVGIGTDGTVTAIDDLDAYRAHARRARRPAAGRRRRRRRRARRHPAVRGRPARRRPVPPS